MPATVHIIPVLRDNYCYVIEGDNKEAVIVDPGQTAPVISAIAHYGLKPVAIFNTHHHADHVAGNAELKSLYHVPAIGPKAEEHMIPGLDQGVSDGDIIHYAGMDFKVIATPGHTKGHVVFYDAVNGHLFSGDTLFSLGCGRLLEDSAEAMFKSLQKLKKLPPETEIFCGHEYTETNAAFAASLGPESNALMERRKEIKTLRLNNRPTVPSLLSQELELNPFLKARDAKDFAALRNLKDSF